MKFLATTAVLATLAASSASAGEFTPLIREYCETGISGWAQSDVLVQAITEQNVRTTACDQARIDALDQAWRAEVRTGSTPTISPVLQDAAAEVPRQRVVASGARMTETFIMGAQGFDVAASEIHGAGPGAVHISDVALEESTQRSQGRLSFTITDPASGAPIGAMTVGVDAESLM